jgi:hypothetical protein
MEEEKIEQNGSRGGTVRKEETEAVDGGKRRKWKQQALSVTCDLLCKVVYIGCQIGGKPEI